MKSIGEVSKISGVSVRTLHYYDQIGILKPSKITDAGYRLYSDRDIAVLQTVLFYRELDFSLSDIKSFINNKDFDKNKALRSQIEVLKLKSQRIDRLISLANSILKGEKTMSFIEFDKTEIENFKNEAKQSWGKTKEYKEYENKGYSDLKEGILADGLMECFVKLGKIKETKTPYSEEAMKAVENLKKYISDNYYECNNAVLNSLGDMYVGDERFKENIDKAGGSGTAEFTREAIKNYIR